MSYIQQSLGDGESVITYARFPALYFIAAWLALLLPLLLLLTALIQADHYSDPFVLGCALLALLGFLIFARMMIRQWSTEIGITSHRFVEKYGLLSMRTNEIALPNIEGVRVNQSVLGRLFGYGTELFGHLLLIVTLAAAASMNAPVKAARARPAYPYGAPA